MTKANKIILFLAVFITPLFFLPITANFYDFNKNYLLWLEVVIFSLLWAVKAGVKKEIKIFSGPFDLPILAMAVASLLGAIFASPNKTEAFLLPGGAGTILGLTLLYFLLLNNFPEERKTIHNALLASSAVLGLLAIYQFFGLGEYLIPASPAGGPAGKLDWLRQKNWTPAGDSLSLITFCLVSGVLGIVNFIKQLAKNKLAATFIGLATVIIFASAFLTVGQILPGKPNALVLLPYQQSWAIAVESFKQKPVFGVGSANFVSAFGRFRPASFNQFDFWNNRFFAANPYILNIWTEIGLLGLGAFLWLLFSFGKHIKTLKNESFFAPLAFSFLLLLLLPGNWLLIFTLYLLLAVISQEREVFSLKLPTKIAFLPAGILVLLFIPVFWFAGRAYAAEIYFKKSLDALAKNNGLAVYNNQIKAIQLNPRRVDFRLSLAQTSFALANSIAINPPTGQLTDQDRANITQLTQQAINEARTAASLNPTNSLVWENLALLYRNLLNLAQGADQWALAAYQQAVITDPVNPRLRVDYGGLFYTLKNYEEAIRQFRNAVDLKPDYANGWYNLAAAYREDKKYPQAYQAMQQTLALVPTDSADWQKAKSEFDELGKELPLPPETPTPKAPASPEEALTEPKPLPSPVINPPIEIPNPEVTPTP